MYLRPRTIDDAVAALAAGGGMILSGGTDFYPALGDRPLRRPVLDISALDELAGITVEPDTIRIGARTTWTGVIRAPLPRAFDGFKAAAREVGSCQIQNTGTVGGNLCNASPAADGVPPLLALDASVELASPRGRRVLPLDRFLLGNRKTALAADEIMTAILVPRRNEHAASSFLKLGARRYLVISIVMVAAVVSIEKEIIREARISVGACSPVARRLFELEKELVGVLGASASRIVEARHLSNLSPIDDVRATGDYRNDATLTMVRRALDACAAEVPV